MKEEINNIIGVIPARYASTRFPGKPLVEIQGKSMIQRVYEQCSNSDLDKVIVATDDQRIKDHVLGFGGQVVMTKTSHQTGTDRCAEVATTLLEAELILNIQGDEPFIDPEDINKVIQLLKVNKFPIATLAKPIFDKEEIENPNCVKVVFSTNNQALYFSRSAIPFNRNQSTEVQYYKHIGLYGFTKETLLKLANLSQSPLELSESLEQLRWIENGYPIGIDITNHESLSVDTPEDLIRINKNFTR